MANNHRLNQIGEIIGWADILFADTAANNNSPSQLNGAITLNLGFAESGEGLAQQAELWNAPGIISVPVLPTQANNNTDAAQALYYNHNDQNIVFAVRDTRSMDIAGNILPGETCVYAPAGQARILLKQDGSVTFVTTDDNTATGNVISAGIGPTGFSVVTPWAKFTIDQTGFNMTLATGASLNITGSPDPTSGGSAATISAGNISLVGTVNLGNPPYLPAIASIIPAAVPGVPIMGAGVGAVVVEAVASGVNISAGV